MIILIPTYIIALCVILVSGKATQLLVGRLNRDYSYSSSVSKCFIWGVITLTTITSYISIFTAIGSGVFITLTITSFAVLIYFYSKASQPLVNRLKISKKRGGLILLLSAVLLIVTISVNESLRLGDTGAYHLQAVRWLTDYGTLLGTGNVIPRVAFNNHLFVFASLFDTAWLKGNVHLLINGLFILFGTLFFGESVYKVLKDRTFTTSSALGLFIVVPIIYYEPSTLNTLYVELSITILLIYLVAQLISYKTESNKPYFLTALIALLITYKASLLPIIILIIPLLKARMKYWISSRNIGIITCFIIVFTPFIVRNLFLSGYPIYPMPFAELWPFQFEWSMPTDQLSYMVNDIKYWARIVGDHTDYKIRGSQKFSWIVPWIKGNIDRYPILFSSFLISFPVLLIGNSLLKRENNYLFQQWIISLIVIGSLWWFIQAPSIRLGYPWIFLSIGCALTCLILLLNEYVFKKSLYRDQFIMSFLTLVTFIFIILLCKGSGIYTRTLGAESHLLTQIKKIPKAEVKVLEVNNSNLTVYIATEYGQCYYHQPPCAPEIGGNGLQYGLELIEEDIASDFKLSSLNNTFKLLK